ncbi:unnamed protein product [Mesocestoides corti]|uniref:BTB domain-containing protein n=1 Tax=Mesocestoides corti TaxID=53468 RepID=A0A0R3UR21_MESCO|nr:unnamed protein product [Mesocestoides corti]
MNFIFKDYSDISLVVGGTQFLAHRVILASRCDYFRALLFGGLSETHSSTIHLNGINSTAFYHVLGYIYTGRLDISGLTVRDALDILGLVCQYNFPNLENALSAHFVRSLTPNNVCQIYDAAITYDLDDLIDACLQTIDRAPATVLAHPQFLRLSRVNHHLFSVVTLVFFHCLPVFLGQILSRLMIDLQWYELIDNNLCVVSATFHLPALNFTTFVLSLPTFC